MSAHTPGPWHASKAGHHTIWAANEVLITDCDTLDPRQPPTDQTQANARLIAAAPLMLEALENIENDNEHMPSTAWELIQAAIAKARGLS